jgi:iron(III) transport system permease protein
MPAIINNSLAVPAAGLAPQPHQRLIDRLSGMPFSRQAAMIVLITVLGFLALYPLLMLLYGSFHSTPPGSVGEFNLTGYREVFTWQTMVILANTIGISFVKTVPAIILAIALAWIIARTDTPWRGKLEVLITLPFFIPPVLTAMAWGILANPQVGVINTVWRSLPGSENAIVNVYSYGGVVWHMMQTSVPFIFLFIVEAFRTMDPSLEESSRMCGASRWRTFQRITLVLMLPVITSSFLLSFIKGLESFESPLFFGTPVGIRVVTTEIYDAINVRVTPDYQFATALGFVVLGVMSLLLLWRSRILRGRNFQTVTGKGYSPTVVKLGPWRWVTFGFCILFFFVTVVLPVGQLIAGSFFQYIGFYTLDSLTLDHYREVYENSELWRAFGNTMLLGFTGATTTMLLGSVVAYITIRTKWTGRRLIDALAWLPWMMPGIVLGVGFLWAFALLPKAIPIYGTMWALFIAYMALGTPIAVRVMSSAYTLLSYDLEECSRVHGANWLQTFWRILIALAWPSFVIGWVFAFFGMMSELSASMLLYSVGSEVLSVTLVRMWANGQAEQVSVIGLMMMMMVVMFRWVQLRFMNKKMMTS